ncbi:DUF305 domain-containing protein [Pseudanabaenaceae cyanobacterium LEGE 13415]|nr:DUF305 domain-containing protein [Pseudanabaenaceae cyanobacterium LEGE 13415]
MKRSIFKTTLFGLSIASTIAFSGLTACSNSVQSSSSPMVGMDHSKMDHGSTNHSMMNMDLGPADENFDLRFIDAMIPHHQGAIDMANDALQKSKRPDIQKLSTAIVTSQQAEIEQMKQWRKAWYNQ